MRWTQRLRGAGMAVATAMLLGSSLAVPAARAAVPPSSPLTDLVNPFIGTENEGNTYPGAAVPFGMVQFSPDTGHNTGYDYSQNHIRGFSSSISRASAAAWAATCPCCRPRVTSPRRTTPSTRRSSVMTASGPPPAPIRSV